MTDEQKTKFVALQDAWLVIRDAIRKEGIVALGKVVFTTREHIIALEPRDKGMVGVTLRYPYEVRQAQDYFDAIEDEKVPKDMARRSARRLRRRRDASASRARPKCCSRSRARRARKSRPLGRRGDGRGPVSLPRIPTKILRRTTSLASAGPQT
jgi:hypothetical protein